MNILGRFCGFFFGRTRPSWLRGADTEGNLCGDAAEAGRDPTSHGQATIKCIRSPVQGAAAQCQALTLLQVSKPKNNEVKRK